ncbi:hypothetical protein [Burkholderia sp. Ac-20379]|uniref:hypothetical protein n=1 Tax=Burkholderia sp. Ac-20379 TaxID=2703900 RepID=UPI0019814D72|nr:hypothetical protein [Burkholderia sp. Ac-20379]MBN3726121.1 hypothetical protein [Burkholderia sp. Ac-20379]
MRIRFFLSSMLMGTALTMSAAQAGVIEQNINDAASGELVKKPAVAGVSCQPNAARGPSFSQNTNSGLGAGYGLASLAVMAASASLLSSVTHGEIRPTCETSRIAKSSEGFKFATPAPTSVTE